MPSMIAPPAGAAPIRPPAQGQMDTHLQASQMAHAASTRAAVAGVLARSNSGGAPGMSMTPPAAGSYKHHVLAMAGGGHAGHVHAAIDKATAMGHFTTQQGADLKAHDGPLMGPAGASTIATLGSVMGGMKGGM